ncbi:hypothetical protein B0J15DRAFT_473271 [Fusarium solani]|uniref:Uncharacterized protein n=1 Tax=Fusarium solani TaxID=169388 RepID=A0A9P9FZW3_FUSSL|nr:uncharacterized protein B0J15DRAFT_473271 [Fusarium solani]KAH7228643.1 hypothetical protein B0J15DRAFT_473271 [Fusarium solani]
MPQSIWYLALSSQGEEEPHSGTHTDIAFESRWPPQSHTEGFLREPFHSIRARGKGNRTDQWCIYRTADGRDVPTAAIEYKAPHKLNRHEIARGLNTGPYPDIQPDRDIINQQAKPGEEFDFDAKWLATAVIMQLFSYMVGKGMQYRYICTGGVFIFLHIPDNDPSMVYYFTSVPSMDRDDERSNSQDSIYRTAVAHVFAFVLHRRRRNPGTPKPTDSQRSKSNNPGADSHDSPSPSQRRANRRNPPRDSSAKSGGKQLQDGQSGSQSNSCGSGQRSSSVRQRMQDRPYCTHTCLHGVAFGGPMDRECPNFADHGNTHIDQGEFRRAMRQQLAVDRDKDADCMPLFLVGSRGSLFKLRLSSYGYTLVAKGVEAMDAEQLRHENRMYDHAGGLQGQYVPVWLGTINLVEPYYFDGGVYTHFMLMGYGGRSILSEVKSIDSGMAD